MLNPDKIRFSCPETHFSEEEYCPPVSSRVGLGGALSHLSNAVVHIACALFELLRAPFIQSVQFVHYNLFSAYRHLEASLGSLLDFAGNSRGHYFIHVASAHLVVYNNFIQDYEQHLQTLEMIA